jgi:hypothetical protein
MQTAGFWIRTFIFWGKFAIVYDVPSYANRGALQNVKVYVTVKSWWFGPPIFDIGHYVSPVVVDAEGQNDAYRLLIYQLGKYKSVVVQPNFIWVDRGGG